jgi:hypothetical protein
MPCKPPVSLIAQHIALDLIGRAAAAAQAAVRAGISSADVTAARDGEEAVRQLIGGRTRAQAPQTQTYEQLVEAAVGAEREYLKALEMIVQVFFFHIDPHTNAGAPFVADDVEVIFGSTLALQQSAIALGLHMEGCVAQRNPRLGDFFAELTLVCVSVHGHGHGHVPTQPGQARPSVCGMRC